jgi:hypothetical protein
MHILSAATDVSYDIWLEVVQAVVIGDGVPEESTLTVNVIVPAEVTKVDPMAEFWGHDCTQYR